MFGTATSIIPPHARRDGIQPNRAAAAAEAPPARAPGLHKASRIRVPPERGEGLEK